MTETFFLDEYYGRGYRSDRPFKRSRLRLETFGFKHNHYGCLKIALVGFLLSLCGLSSTAILVFYEIWLPLKFQQEGVPVEVTVTDCVMEKLASSSKDPVIDYWYQVEDQVYTNTRLLSSTYLTCADLQPGITMDGEYLAHEPSTSRVLYKTPDTILKRILYPVFGVMVVLISLGIGALGAAADLHVLLYIRALWRRYLLARWGRVLDGELISADNFTEKGDKEVYVTVTYTFTTPKKQELTRRQRHKRGDLMHRKLPRKGTPIKVLYVNDLVCVML